MKTAGSADATAFAAVDWQAVAAATAALAIVAVLVAAPVAIALDIVRRPRPGRWPHRTAIGALYAVFAVAALSRPDDGLERLRGDERVFAEYAKESLGDEADGVGWPLASIVVDGVRRVPVTAVRSHRCAAATRRGCGAPHSSRSRIGP